MTERILLNPGVLLIALVVSWGAMTLINEGLTARMLVEGGPVQWLQVLCFALAALGFFRAALRGNGLLIRCVFLTLGALTAFVALEEINWGQSVFNLETPDSFKEWNTQNGISLHNHKAIQRFVHWLPYVTIGILGLFAIIRGSVITTIRTEFHVFLPPHSFLLFFILILFEGIIVFIFVNDVPILGSDYLYWDGMDRYLELTELVIAVAAFSYSYTRNRLLPNPARRPSWQRVVGKRMAAGARILGGGQIGLLIAALPATLALWLAATLFLVARDSISLDLIPEQPIIRTSSYNIYLNDYEVIYSTRNCGSKAVSGRFYLHIMPVNVNDLPEERRQFGYSNLDFRFEDASGGHGSIKAYQAARRCKIEIPLPDYPIRAIRAGQYIPGQDIFWEGEYHFGQ